MATGKPTLDVILLTFGNYTRLEQTIRSVLTQTQPIHTVLLSDDGSGKPFPDDAVRLLESGNFTLKVRNGEHNLGTVAHMNEAARQTDGDYLKFLSAGDALSDAHALEKLMEFARREKASVVTSDCVICSEDLQKRYYHFPGDKRARRLQKKGTELFASLAGENIISAVGTLFHRSFFSEYGGFDEAYRYLEDWPSWLRLARLGFAIPYLPEVTALYALGGVSSRNSNAFCAPRLRQDMLRCYENEILPYASRFSRRAQHRIRFRYSLLSDRKGGDMWRKYPLLYTAYTAKRWLKQQIAP